jgi:hypothetical protein
MRSRTRSLVTFLALGLAIPLGFVVPAAAPAAAAGGLTFDQPTATNLSGTVDLEVTAPPGTRAVRFFLDDVRLSEVTDLYARQTKTAPQWRTATDVGWFPSGSHTLRAEAVTDHGTLTATKRVTTHAQDTAAGVTDLNGSWRFRPARDVPDADTSGDVPEVASASYDDSDWDQVVVPDSWGAVRDSWNDDSGLVGIYRRTIDLDSPADGERTALRFE